MAELKSLELNGVTYDSFPCNLTEADKAEMVNAVIVALPKYDGEVVAE